MQRWKKVAITAVGVTALAVPTVAATASSDDSDTPITGTDLEMATEAALSHLGEGTVSDTEVGDEESMYEVEVTLDDGRQVDVQLDESFAVVGTEDDGTEDDDSTSG